MMKNPDHLKAAKSVRNIGVLSVDGNASFERSMAITGYWLTMSPAPLRKLHAPSEFAHGARLSVSAAMVRISKCRN